MDAPARAGNAITRTVPVRRIGPGGHRDTVIVEHRVQIVLNARPLVWINCLPEGLEPLAVGFLTSEGLLDGAGAIADLAVAPDLARIEVRSRVDPDRLARFRERLSITSGCGGGASGAEEALPPAGSDATFRPEDLTARMAEMADASRLFRTTGGVHLAAVTDGSGLSAFAEDIGRHNAVDKALGRCLLQGVPLGERAILTTGRASADTVAKAGRAGAAVVVSRGATTSRAVTLARSAGVAVVGFAHRNRMNVYTAAWRLGLAPGTGQPKGSAE